jgi:gliding motility-associated-like protein
MLRNLILTLFAFQCFQAFSQTATLFSDNFESTAGAWMIQGLETPNKWQQGNCAGNGLTVSGDSSLYVSDGTAGTGCTVSYTYQNAPSGSGSLFTLAYTTIDASCASSLELFFDYRNAGVVTQDYTEVVYSTDNGISWTTLSTLPVNTPWANTSINLPVALNFSTFEIGFRFTYDEANTGTEPTAVDNVRITGIDTQAPVIVCPVALTESLNGSCDAIADDYGKNLVDLSDNCTDSASIVVTQNIPIGTDMVLAPGGTINIIVTATDEAGNSNSCNFTLTAVDDTDPQITFCPGDTVIYVGNTCEGLLGDYAALATGTDFCSPTLNITQTPVPGTVISGQNITTPVVITLEDASGNSISCNLNALTLDTLPVEVICPTDTLVYADASCDGVLLDYTNAVTATDNCVSSASLLIAQSPLPGSSITADQQITITVTGGIPATPVSCQFTAVLIDTIRPTILCPTPTPLILSNSCDVTMTDYTSLVGWADNCESSASNMIFSQVPAGGTIIDTTTAVTLTVTDPSGNSISCGFIQTVIDNINPVVNCPSDQVLNLNSSCFATIPDFGVLVTTSDNCFYNSAVSISQSPLAGTTLNGPAVITITGTDESGNQSTCVFNVTIADNTAPAVTCPSDGAVSQNASCDYLMPDLSGTVAYSDNCTVQGSLIFVQSPAVGTSLPAGVHTVQITVTDEGGLQGTCSYQLTVEDQILPQIACPGNQNLTVDAGCNAVLGDYSGEVTVSDNCTSVGQLLITQAPTAGSSISSNTQITMTVEDLNGNSVSCNFFALIVDNTAPTLNCPLSLTVTATSACEYLVPDMGTEVIVNDNCPAGLVLTQNPPIGTPISSGPVSVLITANDGNGNTTSCATLLTPSDFQAPIVNCPAPAPVNIGTNCDYTLPNFSGLTLVLDNCSNFQIVQTPAAGTVLTTGSHSIQMDVIDIGGNTAQCSFILDVFETVPPVITCPNDTILCSNVYTFTDPVYSDNCFAFITQTDGTGLTSGSTFPIGSTTTLSYVVADSSGNSAGCSFNITVLDFPSVADILVDSISLCDVTSAVVEALPVTSGTGQWTMLSGQGSINNPSSNLTGINNLNYGTNVFVWTISSASCGSLSDTVSIYTYQSPIPASTIDTVLLCNESILELSANVPLYGAGVWSTTPGPIITDPQVAVTTASNINDGWSQFIWTVSNGSCPVTSDTMNVYKVPVASIALTDTLVCIEDGAFDVNGSGIIAEQNSLWVFIAGAGSLTNPLTSTVTVDQLNIGTNYLVYTVNSDLCLSSSDTVIISASLCDGFQPEFPTVITPNFDGKNDLFVIDYLNELYPKCAVTIFNRWGSVVFESTGYADPWNGTYKNEELPMGTYFFKIDLKDENNTIYNGPISIIR